MKKIKLSEHYLNNFEPKFAYFDPSKFFCNLPKAQNQDKKILLPSDK